MRLVHDGHGGNQPFRRREGSFPAATIHFTTPTRDPIVLVRAAVAAMAQGAVEGAYYLRAGVMFHGLEPAAGPQMLDVFAQDGSQADVGGVLGEVRSRFGALAIGIGVGGLAAPPAWSMKREHSSPRYTTEWAELPVVRA